MSPGLPWKMVTLERSLMERAEPGPQSRHGRDPPYPLQQCLVETAPSQGLRRRLAGRRKEDNEGWWRSQTTRSAIWRQQSEGTKRIQLALEAANFQAAAAKMSKSPGEELLPREEVTRSQERGTTARSHVRSKASVQLPVRAGVLALTCAGRDPAQSRGRS